MSIELLLIATFIAAASGAPGLLLSRRGNSGQWIAMGMNVIGAVVGGAGIVLQYVNPGATSKLEAAWSLPVGRFSVGIDDLSAIFLIPVLLISALGSIYGLEYWKQSRRPRDGRKLRLCWGLMTAGMMLVVLARDGVLLLMAWEIMGLAGYFLVATEDGKPEARWAAWVYLVAAHLGALSLFAMVALMRFGSGSFALWPTAGAEMPGWLATAVFVTGVVGFGLKAGIMPLHVWLPGAHANAPSHVSAIMSGVLLKMGVYGIIRVAALTPHPPIWWGATLLGAGAVSGVMGIAFAVAQEDFKRLLAYSSIENIGIITIGIGLALLGKTLGQSDLIVLGMGGALLHVLNHSLFKPLLFMGAGNILHGTRTRRIDRLGGLAKTMPATFAYVALGAIAICGLPPLNGFVSELLIYMGLFRAAMLNMGRMCVWAAMAAPALAMIGAFALGAFIKWIGTGFGGLPRTRAAMTAHEAGKTMLGPMGALAAGCVIIGMTPMVMMPLIERGVAVWDSRPGEAGVSISGLVPLHWFTIGAIALVAAVLSTGTVIAMCRRRNAGETAGKTVGTWDCGYARPTAAMHYTGSSFGQTLAKMFGWLLLPRRAFWGPSGLFAGRSYFSSEAPDTVLDRGLVPAFSLGQRVLSRVRPMQQGPVQIYLFYMLAILIGMLVFGGWTK